MTGRDNLLPQLVRLAPKLRQLVDIRRNPPRPTDEGWRKFQYDHFVVMAKRGFRDVGHISKP